MRNAFSSTVECKRKAHVQNSPTPEFKGHEAARQQVCARKDHRCPVFLMLLHLSLFSLERISWSPALRKPCAKLVEVACVHVAYARLQRAQSHRKTRACEADRVSPHANQACVGVHCAGERCLKLSGMEICNMRICEPRPRLLKPPQH